MMDSSADVLLKLRDSIRIFASDRNWDQFHSPKNLASTEKNETNSNNDKRDTSQRSMCEES
jgi:hypothetical protein